jgi:uncharacterized SAM-binding protein YcdF (DUF218 family)
MIKFLTSPVVYLRRKLTWRRATIFIGIGTLIWVVGVSALGVVIHAYGDHDNAQPADVIIVLGSGLTRSGRPGDALFRRSVWGAQLYQEGLAPAVICTGGVGEGQSRSEASACKDVLLSRGVPPDAIYLDEESKSTEENAIYSKAIMEAQDWEDAILVTDGFHIFRAGWIFDQQDIRHYRSPVPREWVRDYYYVKHFTREIIAVHWQVVKGILNLPFTNVG